MIMKCGSDSWAENCVLCNIIVIIRVANHVTSDDRVHGISENKLLNSGNIFLDIFVNTCQN